MNDKKILAVLPARIGSTRLPGKPLIIINNKPLIQHTWEGVRQSSLVDRIIVATDSTEIVQCVTSFGGEALLTSSTHPTGTDRTAEVAEKLSHYDIVLNIQGDEPLVTGDMVNQLAEPLLNNPQLSMTALKGLIDSVNDVEAPSVVKVVTDKDGYALYYSRQPIPCNYSNNPISYYRNKGLYGYRRSLLLEFSKLPQGIAETSESLEQLRALENGIRIYVTETSVKTVGVNVPEDVEKAAAALRLIAH